MMEKILYLTTTTHPARKFLLFLLMLVPFLTAGQTVKKHQGPYISGIGVAGEATYYYYEGKHAGDHIRHGSFRFTLKNKDSDKRLFQTIEGNYEHNQKAGNWVYSINTRDFLRENAGLLSGNLTIKASYQNGIPHGRWEYQGAVRHRIRQGSGSVAFTPESKERFVVFFDRGMLVDSFLFESSLGGSMEGVMMKNGLYQGNWIIKENGLSTQYEFYHGVLISMQKLDLEDNVIEKQPYEDNERRIREFEKAQKSKTIEKLEFLPDTSDMLAVAGDEFAKKVLAVFFNDSYCLLQYVPGDAAYFYDKGKFINQLKGMRKQGFRNQVTPSNTALLGQLRQAERSISSSESSAKRMVQGKNQTDEIRSRLQLLSTLSSNASRFYCVANGLCQDYDFSESLKNSILRCQKQHGGVPAIPDGLKTRDEVLNYLLGQVNIWKRSASDAEEAIRKALGS